MRFALLCAVLLPALSVHKPPTFSASVLGVRTRITLHMDDHAHVRVHGIGFKKEGIARVVGNSFLLDESFDAFLRGRHVNIERVVERTGDHIVVCVRVPMWGRFNVRLLRETNLA